jgi:hypothetical protein
MDGLRDFSHNDISRDGFDSISEIGNNISIDNRKNTSFYSLNEAEHHRGSSSKKVDVDAIKMLPMYIDRVNQNIRILETLIKDSKENSRVESNNNSGVQGNGTSQFSTGSSSIVETKSQKVISVVKPERLDFAVIEERDEDLMSRASNLNETRNGVRAVNKVGLKKIKVEGLKTNYATLTSKNSVSTNSPRNKAPVNIANKKLSISTASVNVSSTIDVKKLKNSGEAIKKKSIREVEAVQNSIQGAINNISATLNNINNSTVANQQTNGIFYITFSIQENSKETDKSG